MKAIWNHEVIAESENTIAVEGNHYFPPESVNQKFLTPSEHTSVCPWKGVASYYHVNVKNEMNADAAWYYPETEPEAENIKNYVAFWKGVQVLD